MVHVKKRPVGVAVKDDLIIGAAETTLRLEDADGDITILLTDDAQLRELNRQYLGVDAPTDVLSFPSGEADPETGRMYLGDIVISVPQARIQAAAAGHELEAEAQLLVVHGALHLLGYDHAEARDKTAMWAAQDRALKALGLEGITIHA